MSKVNPNAERLPKLDDYELRPHYDIDYRKARRNPYAGRVKFTHGGKRNGAERKSTPEPLERHTITLYKTHANYLRRLDSNLSRAIRTLIDRAR
ncbi:MAG: hypothetical protein HY327_03070 [Chloroflexi bacterium]|nr:hypothetical protein [Chloroflexota bacterium]